MDGMPDLRMIRDLIMENMSTHEPFRIVYPPQDEDFFFGQAVRKLEQEAKATHRWLFEHDVWARKQRTVEVPVGKSDESVPLMAYPLADRRGRVGTYGKAKYLLGANTSVLVTTRAGTYEFEPDRCREPMDEMEWIIQLLCLVREQ
jgi:hypothetical protein